MITNFYLFSFQWRTRRPTSKWAWFAESPPSWSCHCRCTRCPKSKFQSTKLKWWRIWILWTLNTQQPDRSNSRKTICWWPQLADICRQAARVFWNVWHRHRCFNHERSHHPSKFELDRIMFCTFCNLWVIWLVKI